jgi:hypothetical protein
MQILLSFIQGLTLVALTALVSWLLMLSLFVVEHRYFKGDKPTCFFAQAQQIIAGAIGVGTAAFSLTEARFEKVYLLGPLTVLTIILGYAFVKTVIYAVGHIKPLRD